MYTNNLVNVLFWVAEKLKKLNKTIGGCVAGKENTEEPLNSRNVPTSSIGYSPGMKIPREAYTVTTCLRMTRSMTKPTKWMCAQRRSISGWASIQSDQSSLSAGRSLWSLGMLRGHVAKNSDHFGWSQQRLWSGCADAHFDLSLRWAHSHFVGYVMLRLTSSRANAHRPG